MHASSRGKCMYMRAYTEADESVQLLRAYDEAHEGTGEVACVPRRLTHASASGEERVYSVGVATAAAPPLAALRSSARTTSARHSAAARCSGVKPPDLVLI